MDIFPLLLAYYSLLNFLLEKAMLTSSEALDAGTGKCYDHSETTLTLLRLVLVGVNLQHVK